MTRTDPPNPHDSPPAAPELFTGTIAAVIRVDGHQDTASRLDTGLRAYLATWASNTQVEHIRVHVRPALTRRAKARIIWLAVAPFVALLDVALGLVLVDTGRQIAGAAVIAAGVAGAFAASVMLAAEIRRMVSAEREDTLR